MEIFLVTEQRKSRRFSNTVGGTLSRQTQRGRNNCYQSGVLSEDFLHLLVGWKHGVHVYTGKDLPNVYKDVGSGTEQGNK